MHPHGDHAARGTDQAATWSGVGFGAKLTFTPA